MEVKQACQKNAPGTDGPVTGTEGPARVRMASSIVENAFNCRESGCGFNCRGSRGSPKKWPKKRTRAQLKSKSCDHVVLALRCRIANRMIPRIAGQSQREAQQRFESQ